MRRIDREITSTGDIEEIILKADVCRLALANDNIPYIVTMNFGYSNDPKQILFFHCANEGKKIEMIRRNNYVCFEMDIDHKFYTGKKSCTCGMKFSSIIGYGTITIIKEKEAKIEGLNCIMDHYEGKEKHHYEDQILERTTVLRLEILEIGGKKC